MSGHQTDSTITFCECIAGGLCRQRGPQVQHAVRLLWSHDDEPRTPQTIASPAQLDELMSAGEIVGAICTTCQDDVTGCPAVRPYVIDGGWELPSTGRDALRGLVRQDPGPGDPERWIPDALAGLRYVLLIHGGPRVTTLLQEQQGEPTRPTNPGGGELLPPDVARRRTHHGRPLLRRARPPPLPRTQTTPTLNGIS